MCMVRAPTDITTEALQRIGELYAIEAEVRDVQQNSVWRQKSQSCATDVVNRNHRDTDSDENTVASLGYGKSVRIPAETVGWPERVLQQWLGGNRQQHRRERLTGSGRRPEKLAALAGSDSGGEHAAVLYSLIGTCRRNAEPEKWLRYVIEHIQDWPANRVRDLLPWKVDLSSQ